MLTGTLSPAVLSLDALLACDPHAPAGATKRRFCCPLPDCAGKPLDAEHRSLELEVATGWWTCYRCDAHGRLREHWRGASGPGTRPRANRPVLVAHSADKRAVGTAAAAVRAAAAPRPAFDWRAAYDRAEQLPGTAGAAYLAGRGVPAPLAAAAGVRFSRAWYGRSAVLFPVCDRAGALVAVSGRCLDDRSPHSLTGGPKSRGVFATPGALATQPLVIAEAPIDALSLGAAGVPAIALCGKTGPAWLPEACAFRPVVLALDGDAAGDDAAAKLAPVLQRLGATVERWRPTAGKDWNELAQHFGAAALRTAIAVSGCWVRGCPSPIAVRAANGTAWCRQHTGPDATLGAGATVAGDGYPLAGDCARCGAFRWRPPGTPPVGWLCAACAATNNVEVAAP